MPTEQIELTTPHVESITEQTTLIEKLNCLEFETSQLNRAYQLWRSYIEQGTPPDWMAAATRITYDALITFCLEVSTILADGPHAFSARRLPEWETSAFSGEEGTTAELSPELLPMTHPNCSGQAELTTEQTELIEKLNCLEFETAQLNRAYQLWTSYVEKGTAPEWMTAAIRFTYDALIMFWLEVSTILADGPHPPSARRLVRLEISGFLQEASATAELSPKLLAMTQSDWTEPETPAAILPPSSGDVISVQPNIQPGQQEVQQAQQEETEADVPQRLLAQLRAAAYEILEEESTTGEPSSELLPITDHLLPMTEPDWSGPEMPVFIFQPLTDDTISEQPEIQPAPPEVEDEESLQEEIPEEEVQSEDEADVYAFSERPLPQLQAAPCEISGLWEEESTTEDQSPEFLRLQEPDWPLPEMPVATSLRSAGDEIPEQPAIQQGELEEDAAAEPANVHSLATLADWMHGSSTSVFFFVPPGTLRRIFGVTSLAILIVAGGTTGIYLNARRAASKPAILPVQNSAAQPAAGAVVIPTGDKAGFKFDPDPVVAPLGRSFVLSAVLSRGTDIASMALQIDYDANLLRFVGVSQGGFLVKHGQQVAVVQHDDPSTGVLKISAEQSPGNPGISGDGPLFTLSFQAKKRGNATVSIVPGAHDSLGRRIEMAGSQVSVRVN